MSKIGNYNLELQEQANELGFENLQEAIENGYTIDFAEQKLVSLDELQNIAHEEWLKEKQVVLGDLNNMLIGLSTAGKSDSTEYGIIQHAIKFINEGEH